MSCCDDKSKAGQEPSKLAQMVSGPRRLWLIAAVAVGAGLLLGWEQLVVFGIAPILISLLPCLIMCALGVCMMCKTNGQLSAFSYWLLATFPILGTIG